jgi:hypothetical protein
MASLDAQALAEIVEQTPSPSPRIKPRNPFKGITRAAGKWTAQIRFSRPGCEAKTYYLGTFKTPEEAARAYDAAVDQFKPGEAKNFPASGEKKAPCHNPRHGFFGVFPKRGRWVAIVWNPRKGRAQYLGSFELPEDAGRARDREIRNLGLDAPLNFPGEGGES